MALGSSGISAVRDELAVMETKIQAAKDKRQELMNLYNDENFKTFISDTNKGKEINDQIMELTEWIDKMCEVLEGMQKDTSNYLDNQASING